MKRDENVRRLLITALFNQSESARKLVPNRIRNDVWRLTEWLWGNPAMSPQHAIGAQRRILYWVKTGKIGSMEKRSELLKYYKQA